MYLENRKNSRTVDAMWRSEIVKRIEVIILGSRQTET
jgi:hypothetical protein